MCVNVHACVRVCVCVCVCVRVCVGLDKLCFFGPIIMLTMDAYYAYKLALLFSFVFFK